MAKKKDKDKGGDDEEEGKKGPLKNPKILGIAGIVVAGLAYQFVLKPPPPTEEDPAAMEEVAPVEGAIVELEEMILNLDDPDVNYLRVGVAIVLTETEDPKLFEADSAIAKDVIVDYLGSLSAADFAAGEARNATKEELGKRMIEAYGEDRVMRVLFTSLVMQ